MPGHSDDSGLCRSRKEFNPKTPSFSEHKAILATKTQPHVLAPGKIPKGSQSRTLDDGCLLLLLVAPFVLFDLAEKMVLPAP